MKESRIIIRVYGIYIDKQKGLLVSDELIKTKHITKFPGGGLEFGEGPMDCLKREMIEETGFEFNILSHFYTTDYFVQSVFDPNRQIVSIYYLIEPVKDLKIRIAEKPFDFPTNDEGSQSFRFISINEINKDQFILSIDRHVALLLMERYK